MVTIVIVSYNTRDVLARCLQSLETTEDTCDTRIVIVDNGSVDGSPEMVSQRFPYVTLIQSNSNLGFGKANNLALHQLDTPYALLLNSDTEVPPGLVHQLLDWAGNHPGVGAVGVQLVNRDGTLQRSCWRFPSPWRAMGEALGIVQLARRRSDYGEWDYSADRRVDFVIGACLLLRTAALSESGLFDERYFLYGEDADLCKSMRSRGWETWYTPLGPVLHLGGASGSTRTSFQFLYAQDQFMEKWYGRHGVKVLRISQLLGATIRLCSMRLRNVLLKRTESVEWMERQTTLLRWSLQKSRYHPLVRGSQAVGQWARKQRR